MYTIDEIKKKAIPIAEEYGIKTLKLFGSYAKGLNNKSSDIDFIVNISDNKVTEYIYITDVLYNNL